MSEREDQIFLAKLAEQAERYEDMASLMKKVAESNPNLSIEERNLLSVAFKNLVGGRRNSWRVTSSVESRTESSEKRKAISKDYRLAIEQDLKASCGEILELLEKHLIPTSGDPDSKVFYLKMKGDYYRYLSEIASPDEKTEASGAARSAYDEAVYVAEDRLPTTNPIRLGLALNFSVFYYEIENNPQKACQMAQTAFDDAIADLDSLNEDSYKDSTLIMQLLRDNLTLWSSDAEPAEDETAPGAPDAAVAKPEAPKEEGKAEEVPAAAGP